MFTLILDNQDLSNSILEFFNIKEDQDIELELEVDIFYKVFGSNKPATFYDPAEYAEIDDMQWIFRALSIDGVTMALTAFQLERVKTELNELFSGKEWQDKLESLCWENVEDFAKRMADWL